MSEYERIRAACLEKHRLWEDNDFPALRSSVFYHQTPPFIFSWQRPKQIYNNPTFHEENAEFDVVPGRLGDKWLVSSLGILYQSQKLFTKVVHPEQQFMDRLYAGIFRFHIWWCGEWREVLVDDRLPMVGSQLAFAHSVKSPQMWASLLEKAYAKLLGSYEGLKYSAIEDGLAELTGGISEVLPMKNFNCAKALNTLLETASIVTAPYEPSETSYYQKQLDFEMNYKICEVVQLQTTSSDILEIVRVQRPMLSHMGHLHISFSEEIWMTITVQDRKRMIETPGFWILFKDFCSWFPRLEIVHLSDDWVHHDPFLRIKMPWKMLIYQSAWKRGVNAGGCRNQGNFFHVNPQIQMYVPSRTLAMIALNQHSIIEPKVIGFSIYKLHMRYDLRVTPSFFTSNRAGQTSQYGNSRQISLRCELEPGTYLIVPTTYDARQEAKFSLRVFSTKTVEIEALDDPARMNSSAILKAPADPDKRFALTDYVEMFLQLGDDYKTVNIFELQELLEACLPNDYIKSCATLETCRQIVLALDKNGSGRLALADFKDLMRSLKNWQTVFSRHTLEKMGVLRAERLRDALKDVGFWVPEQTLSLLVLRYMRKDGMLRFGDFVCAVLHLSRAFEIFQSKGQTSIIQMTLDEWLNYTVLG